MASTQNIATEGAIKTYLSMERPGYAVLIDAPWGAGKTHFIRKACEVRPENEAVRYATLNGVSDETGFRRAILKDSLDGDLAGKTAKIGDIIGKITKLGNMGSLARDVWEDQLLKSLPETLIFDDLERSILPPEALFGLLNDFVEHQGKRVILLVNSDTDAVDKSFLTLKEKVVGRTLRLEADFDDAFPHFISLVKDGKGREYLKAHIEDIRTVFGEAKHNNLRLLRNALRDCAMLLDQIDDDLFKAEDAMATLLRTYLALAMALAKGEITAEDLSERSNHRIAMDDDTDDKGVLALRELFKRPDSTEMYTGNGSVLPGELSDLLFVTGHIEANHLNELLTGTGKFTPPRENPLWLQAAMWRSIGWSNLGDLIERGNGYLFCTDHIEPGPYLHITDMILSIHKRHWADEDYRGLCDNICRRIAQLRDNGGIPIAHLGTEFGWRIEGGRFSFGGYTHEIYDGFTQIAEAMREAQLSGYGATIPSDADRLLIQFRTDLDQFLTEIAFDIRQATYHRVPILQHIDANSFAKAAAGHLISGNNEKLAEALDTLATRHNQHGDWKEERCWAVKVRVELERLAREHSVEASAHLEWFLGLNWRFLEPDEQLHHFHGDQPESDQS